MKQAKLPTLQFKQAYRVKKFAETELMMCNGHFFASLPEFRAYESLTELPISQMWYSNFVGTQRPSSNFSPIGDYKLRRKVQDTGSDFEQELYIHEQHMYELSRRCKSLLRKY